MNLSMPIDRRRALRHALISAAAAFFLAACGGGGGQTGTPVETYSFDLPGGFPQPRVPADNPMSGAKVALGRALFYDQRLAINGKGSCASCHEQRRAFTDGRTTAVGPTGDVHPRNAMSLTNVVYNARQNWANPALTDLRLHARAVMFNQEVIELGWTGHEDEILARFRADGNYRSLFAAAYPGVADPFTTDNVAKAIAAFGATLISGRSAYDRASDSQHPDPTAMSESARRGENLFFSERLECFHCHGSFNFAQSVVHEGSALDAIEYKNNALYNIAGNGGDFPLPAGNYPPNNRGLYAVTGVAEDMGKFRAPTLRNIALTAPYMHDGSIATLREVIVDHYANSGRTISGGPYAGNGAASPYKDSLMVGFTISDSEVEDLLAFLDSLTDWNFICDARFADPNGAIPMHEHCSGGL